MDNPPRMLPQGLEIVFRKNAWPIPSIFKRIQEKGNVQTHEMFHTFNMGIGLMLAIDPRQLKPIQKFWKESYVLGEVRKGNSGVVFQ